MGGRQGWLDDLARCVRAKGRRVHVPDGIGIETVPELVTDVMSRRVYYDGTGIYIIRGAGAVQVVGLTQVSLGVRLRTARANRAKWFDEDISAWTVTLQNGDVHLLQSLVELHRPPFNRGYVRKVDSRPREILLEAAGEARKVGELHTAEVLEAIVAEHFASKVGTS